MRRRCAQLALLPALLSAAWLAPWSQATGRGCRDGVCLCSDHCASRARCHEEQDETGPRMSGHCSHGPEAALRSPLPALPAVSGALAPPQPADPAVLAPPPAAPPAHRAPEPHPPPPPRT